ncbi:MAG: DUF493 domain-containing protein, partial [Wenzhouxiangellaceae bacterium]|nr:DUF493 domain-containing protein [Wenzhouxiangellaceae bacterium]
DATGALEFPCRFPVKAMTHAREQALEQVLDVMSGHGAQPDRDSVRIRPSRNGHYQSITVEIRAESRRQLEAVYAALRELDIVVMTL